MIYQIELHTLRGPHFPTHNTQIRRYHMAQCLIVIDRYEMICKFFLCSFVMDALAGATTQIKRVKREDHQFKDFGFYSLDLRGSTSKSIHLRRKKKTPEEHIIHSNTLSHAKS